jgi:hypothetical protein
VLAEKDAPRVFAHPAGVVVSVVAVEHDSPGTAVRARTHWPPSAGGAAERSPG